MDYETSMDPDIRELDTAIDEMNERARARLKETREYVRTLIQEVVTTHEQGKGGLTDVDEAADEIMNIIIAAEFY